MSSGFTKRPPTGRTSPDHTNPSLSRREGGEDGEVAVVDRLSVGGASAGSGEESESDGEGYRTVG